MPTTSVRIGDDLDRQIEQLAKELDRSKSWIIIRAVTEYLERVDEERKRWHETMEAVDSVAKGNLVGADEVKAWVNSWYKSKEKPKPRKRS